MATQIELIKKHKLSIRGHWGQHLLVDPNMQRKIVDLLDPRPEDVVLEIGPALGALTGEILRRGAKVLAVEKDENLIKVLREEFFSYLPDRLEIIHGDFLKIDILKLFEGVKVKRKSVKAVSNLPYYITSPILFRLVDYRSLISKAIVTMQKEVARRLVAHPGTKDYSRLTLGIRYAADVELAFHIPPACFTPKPKVESSVVMMSFHSKRGLQEETDETLLFHLIKVAFSQRRKTLIHLFLHDSKVKMDRNRILRIFEKIGISETVRGEEISLKDFMALAEELRNS